MLSDPNISGACGYTEGARVYHDAQQVMAYNDYTTLLFNQERYDTNNIHDKVTNNSRLTCKTAGVYIIWGGFDLEEDVNGWRSINIYLNGTTHLALHSQTPAGWQDRHVHLTITTIYKLEVGDYVELRCYQTAENVLISWPNLNRSPEFAMQRIG